LGILGAEVQAVKRQNDRVWVGLNTGLNQLIRPMMYGSYHEVEVLNSAGRPIEKCTLVGNICETDTLAEHRDLPRMKVGDLVVFYNAGAYGYSMASQYNLQGKPAEVWIPAHGGVTLIRRAETLAEMVGSYLKN
jgi:diaminopimelate decarboxylase